MEHHFVAFFVKALDDVYMICQVKWPILLLMW
jgi:hypothetical protein